MSVNKERPHVYVLPEDDANRQVANGFLTHYSLNGRVIQVLPPAGGWPSVREQFKEDYVAVIRRYPLGYIILMVDFDTQEDRLEEMCKVVPDDLKDRVFVIGVWSEPEKLRSALGLPFEKIGFKLAGECQANTIEMWQHELLAHNTAELQRMPSDIRNMLFK